LLGVLFFADAPNGEGVDVPCVPNWKVNPPGLLCVFAVDGVEDVGALNEKVGLVSCAPAVALFPLNTLPDSPFPGAGDPAGVVLPGPKPPNGFGANWLDADSPFEPPDVVVFPNPELIPKLNFGVVVLAPAPSPDTDDSLGKNPNGDDVGFCVVVELEFKPVAGVDVVEVLAGLLKPKLNLGGAGVEADVACTVLDGTVGLANENGVPDDDVFVVEGPCEPPAAWVGGAVKPLILDNRSPPVDGAGSRFFFPSPNIESAGEV
jgi:hypothetical protein